jgi:hypothetical protein
MERVDAEAEVKETTVNYLIPWKNDDEYAFIEVSVPASVYGMTINITSSEERAQKRDYDRSFPVSFHWLGETLTMVGDISQMWDLKPKDFKEEGKRWILETVNPWQDDQILWPKFHTEGMTSKTDFRLSAEEYFDDNPEDSRRKEIMDFIDECDCPPERVLKKLKARYANLVEYLRFENNSLEAIASSQALWAYLVFSN